MQANMSRTTFTTATTTSYNNNNNDNNNSPNNDWKCFNLVKNHDIMFCL